MSSGTDNESPRLDDEVTPDHELGDEVTPDDEISDEAGPDDRGHAEAAGTPEGPDDRGGDGTTEIRDSSGDAGADPPRRRRRPVRRLVRVLALLVLVGLFGSWYWIESPGGTDWLRARLESWGSSMIGAPLRISGLEIDLVPFRARLEGVTIEPADPNAATSASVDTVTVELSTLGLLQRRVEVTELELVRPRVRLVIPTPRPRGPVTDVVDAVGPVSIDLQRVRVVDGELSWLHRTTRIDGTLSDVSLTVTADARSVVDGGRRGRLRVGDGQLDLSARAGSTPLLAPVVLEARFAPEPTGISVDALRAEIGSSRLEGGGEIRGTGTADLDLTGDVAVNDIFAFWQPPGPDDHDGTVAFDGTLQLRDGSPLLAGAVSGEAVRLAGLDLDGLRADVQLRASAITLRNVEADLLEGRARADLIVDRSAEPTTTQLTYSLEGLDAAGLTLWQALPGWRFAGEVAAAGEVAWSGSDVTTLTGNGLLEIDAADLAFPRRPPPAPGGTATATTAADTADGERTVATEIPSLPLPARGRIEYGIRRGRMQIDAARLSLPGTELTASGRVDPAGELLVFAEARSSDLRMLDHLAAQLRSFLRAEPVSRFGVAGSGRIELRLAGRTDRPTIGGAVGGERLRVKDVEMGRYEASLRSEGEWLYADNVRVAGGRSSAGGGDSSDGSSASDGGTASGEARLRIHTADGTEDDFSLRATLRRFDLAMELALPPRDRRLVGRTDGDLTIRGRYGEPVGFDIDVEIEAPTLGRQKLDRAAVVATRDAGAWTIDRLEIGGFGGSVIAAGGVRPAASELTADVRFEHIALDEAVALLPRAQRVDVEGHATGRLSVAGPIDRLSGDGSVRVDRAAWRELPLGRVSSVVRFESGAVAMLAAGGPDGVSFLDLPPLPRTIRSGSVPSLPAAAPDRWFVGAAVEPGGTARAAFEARAPARLLAELGRSALPGLPETLALAGQVEARGSGPLADLGSWVGEASATTLALEQDGVDLLSVDRAEASLAEGTLVLDADIDSDASRLSVRPTWSLRTGALGGSLRGDVDLATVVVSDEGTSLGGRFEMDVTLGGTIDRPSFEGTASVVGGRLTSRGPYEVTEVNGAVALGDGQIRLDELRGRLGATEFAASGAIPARALLPGAEESGTWRMSVDNLPLSPLLERSDAISRLFDDGRVSAEVELGGRGLDWRTYRGELQLGSLLLRAGEYRIELREPTRLVVASGRLRAVEALTLSGTRTDLTLLGEVDPSTGELDVQARGELGLEPLNVLSPDWGIGGRLEVDVRIAGTLPDPTYDGTGRLLDALLSPPPLRQPLESINGTMSFENRRVRFEDIEARFGGGEVMIAGELFLRDSLPQSFRYTMDVERALLRLESDVRARITGQLVHDGTPQDSLLSAQIEVDEGIYRRAWAADQAILELLEAPETDPDPLLAAIDLDLRVQGADGFLIDNNLADVEVDADYNIRGTAADPIILGRSSILTGRLFWGANAFDVVQGVVEFNNPFETEPVFEIRARTAIRRYTVDLTFSGSLQRGVSFSYSSTPPLSDLDLFNLLALGEEPDSEVLRDSYGAAVGLQATRYLASQLFSEVERGAQRAFGLDRFLISPTLQGTETDATARFTVGKRINRNLYVTYSRLISTSEDQLLTVEYQVSPDVRITGTREEDGSFGLDFLVQKRIR